MGAVADGAGRSDGRDGLSWGAGDGAMAMAALIVNEMRSRERSRIEVCEALAPKAAGWFLALSQGLTSPVELYLHCCQGLGPLCIFVLGPGAVSPFSRSGKERSNKVP